MKLEHASCLGLGERTPQYLPRPHDLQSRASSAAVHRPLCKPPLWNGTNLALVAGIDRIFPAERSRRTLQSDSLSIRRRGYRDCLLQRLCLCCRVTRKIDRTCWRWVCEIVPTSTSWTPTYNTNKVFFLCFSI